MLALLQAVAGALARNSHARLVFELVRRRVALDRSLSKLAGQLIGDRLERRRPGSPQFGEPTMTFHDMPAQVRSGEHRTSQFHGLAERLGIDVRHVEHLVKTSRVQQPLTLVVRGRHDEAVRHCPVIPAMQARQAAQKGAVQIVAMG